MRTRWLILSLLIPLFFLSCSRYEEGPVFSFKSPEARITGTWQATEVLTDDLENESLLTHYQNRIVTFKEDGIVSIELINNGETIETINGTWNLSDSKEELVILLADSYEETSYEINRLTGNELWLVEHVNSKSSSQPVIETRYNKF